MIRAGFSMWGCNRKALTHNSLRPLSLRQVVRAYSKGMRFATSLSSCNYGKLARQAKYW